MILLNENTPMKKMPVVNEFMQIAENIKRFDASKQLGSYSFNMLTEGNTDEGEE